MSDEYLKPPTCHFTPMVMDHADDGLYAVAFWECEHCGHTKDFSRRQQS